MKPEAVRITGGWSVGAVIGGKYFRRRYYGYTKKEALALFMKDAVTYNA